MNFPTNASTAVEGLQINRLSKWSVGSYRAFAFRVVAGGEATGAMAPAMFAFRLELDINTAPFEANSPPLPKDKLVEIFQELIAKGTAITVQGVKNP